MLILVDESIVFKLETLLLEQGVDVPAELRQRQPANVVRGADGVGPLQLPATLGHTGAGLAIALLGPAGCRGAKGTEGDQRERDEAAELEPKHQRRDRRRIGVGAQSA